jgi:hypothetical protein
MPVQSGIQGKTLAIAFAGGILLWSGLKGKKVTFALRDLIAGKNPANAPGNPITGLTATGPGNVTGFASNPGPSGAALGAEEAKNQAIGRTMVTAAGWGDQWESFNNIVMAESGWNNRITNGGQPYNPETVAYGIPQALPASKMGLAANPPVSSATAQIAWMIGYIASRYGNPNAAWAYHLADGSY